MSVWLRPIIGAACMAGAVLAAAAPEETCSRVIKVPLAQLGRSVTFVEDGVAGVYPEVLRGLEGGCKFEFTKVPRARLEQMFASGHADLLVPATRTDRRDEFADFVAAAKTRTMLISLDREVPELTMLVDLLSRNKLRVVVVRGFDFGPVYRHVVSRLAEQKRLVYAVDPVDAARMLDAKMADLSIMNPGSMAAAALDHATTQALVPRLHYRAVDDLPWVEAGIYLSRVALSTGDRMLLTRALEHARRSGAIWKALSRHYPADVLAVSFREK
ncbi:MAG TPA: hypothetical protein VGE47_10940 [Burkholderiaceae bacterium]